MQVSLAFSFQYDNCMVSMAGELLHIGIFSTPYWQIPLLSIRGSLVLQAQILQSSPSCTFCGEDDFRY